MSTLKSVKRFARSTFLILLTLGASLTLGLLSFSGMFLLFPIISWALISFVLAVAYEGEIYWQNLKGAFKTLFSRSALKRQLFREYIHEHITLLLGDLLSSSTQEAQLTYLTSKGVPIELIDYIKLTREYEALAHHQQHHLLSEEDARYRKKLKAQIKRLELIFSELLLEDSLNTQATAGQTTLHGWFHNPSHADTQNHQLSALYQSSYRTRSFLFWVAKPLSLCAGGCIFIGTGYLLFDAFTTIPLLATFIATAPAALSFWLVFSLAVVAGLAYAALTYYSITAMINNRTLQKFASRIFHKQSGILNNILRASLALFLVTLTVIFTVCTAGTWWTISQNLAFIFEESWLKAATFFIFVSTLFINGFNALCTWLEWDIIIEHATTASDGKSLSHWEALKKFSKEVWKNYWEPISDADAAFLQWNLPRLVIKLISLPVDLLLFLAHVISIGITGDQIEGLPRDAAILFGTISEVFEDAHRIFPHEHHCDAYQVPLSALLGKRGEAGSGHEHALNLPRKLVHFLLFPLYGLAILWDTLYLKLAGQEASWKDAFGKGVERQWGGKKQEKFTQQAPELTLETERLDKTFRVEEALHHLDYAAADRQNVAGKKQALGALREIIAGAADTGTITQAINHTKALPVIQQKRAFFWDSAPGHDETTTAQALGGMIAG